MYKVGFIKHVSTIFRFFSVFSNDPAWFRCQVRTRAVPACPYCRLQGYGDKGPLACRKMRLKWTNGFKFTLTIHIHTNMAFLVVLLLCIVYFQIYNNIILCYVTSMVLVHGETHRNYTVFHVNVSTQQATFNSSHGCSQLFAFFIAKADDCYVLFVGALLYVLLHTFTENLANSYKSDASEILNWYLMHV